MIFPWQSSIRTDLGKGGRGRGQRCDGITIHVEGEAMPRAEHACTSHFFFNGRPIRKVLSADARVVRTSTAG